MAHWLPVKCMFGLSCKILFRKIECCSNCHSGVVPASTTVHFSCVHPVLLINASRSPVEHVWPWHSQVQSWLRSSIGEVSPTPHGLHYSVLQGNVYVKCPSIAAAIAAVNALHGRWFAGECSMYMPSFSHPLQKWPNTEFLLFFSPLVIR